MAPTAAIDSTTCNPRRVCFSFAAYAKTVIDHLKSRKVPVAEGLTDEEFVSIESAFNFRFPPDLRSILQEGLPIGLGFPNWRSSSHQQLQIIANLPISGLLNEISKGNFWCQAWGPRPQTSDEALSRAKPYVAQAPPLVPIYRYCYISSQPNLAGNPVFYVRGGECRYSGYDVAGFFAGNSDEKGTFGCWSPAWAAKAARRIDFWSELVEQCESRGSTCGWWEVTCEGEEVSWGERKGWLGVCLEQVRLMLREGGWREEEVREMLEGDEGMEKRVKSKDGVLWHVRLLSLMLRRAGWSREDVGYALGLEDEQVGS
ncbi:uncharacterized protein [Aristolochia californica]|uniref:uncharacterized protein n=1 Tax=Aristolochia californica TaxID=171875 RepID=UPI0035D663DD